MSRARVYLDWNATAPLRVEAKAAMLEAMEVLGNPSSVHAEGRSARAIIEKARVQVAGAIGAQATDIVFTSGSTEAAALAMGIKKGASSTPRHLVCAEAEHECILAHSATDFLKTSAAGQVDLNSVDNAKIAEGAAGSGGIFALHAANSETGVLQDIAAFAAAAGGFGAAPVLTDATQAFGKTAFSFSWSGADMALISSHKIGGPKGVGALVLAPGTEITAQITGGGHEAGRRAGTENLIGIAGFGAAAAAATRDLDAGLWQQVAEMRDAFEARLLAGAPGVVIFGKDAQRLPNTSYFALPGWKGETQVMQMDLAGYAVSAGSACSSGKVKVSRTLQAMGYGDVTASSAIRVSIGPATRLDDLMGFADTWLAQMHRHTKRAA